MFGVALSPRLQGSPSCCHWHGGWRRRCGRWQCRGQCRGQCWGQCWGIAWYQANVLNQNGGVDFNMFPFISTKCGFFFQNWMNWENGTTFFWKCGTFKFFWKLGNLTCEEPALCGVLKPPGWRCVSRALLGPQKRHLVQLAAGMVIVDSVSGDQDWKDLEPLWWSRYYVYRLYTFTYSYYDTYIGTSCLSTVIQPWADGVNRCFHVWTTETFQSAPIEISR